MCDFIKSNKSFFCVLGLVTFFSVSFLFFFSPPKNFPENIVINVRDGESLRAIAEDLKINNVIRSKILFKNFTVFLRGDRHIQSGYYLFENKMSVFEIARRISNGEHHLPKVEVTIPEGFNVSQISDAFVSKLPDFNKNRFLILAKEKEGYFFPDTYFFLTGDNEENVVDSMSKNFQKRIAPILPEIITSGRSLGSIIVMASIIEKESKGDIDRDMISGILWKRLAKGMPLQVDSAMETYKSKGLPQSPICNPGLKAIEAAVNPKSSPYLYYLHDKNGNIHYASTFEGHILNKKKYIK